MVMPSRDCLLFRREPADFPRKQPLVEHALYLPDVRFRTFTGQKSDSGQTAGSVAIVRQAGNAGHFEAQCGHLALERSQHVGVRGYATQTVKDADEMLNRAKFINEVNVGASTPAGFNNAPRTVLKRLVGRSGADFD